MDSDSFFGFDTTLPGDDGRDSVLEEDTEDVVEEEEEYDAFNDETFGSAAISNDWEESHEHLASLTEAEKLQRPEKASYLRSPFSKELGPHYSPGAQLSNQDWLGTKLKVSAITSHGEFPTLFKLCPGPTLPATCVSPLFGSGHVGSPGNSIWTPTVGLDSLRPSPILLAGQKKDILSMLSNGAPVHKQLRAESSHLFGLPELLDEKQGQHVQTVAELEECLKKSSVPSLGNIKAITVEDLERKLAVLSAASRTQNVDETKPPAGTNLHPPVGCFSSLPNPPYNFTLNVCAQDNVQNQGSCPVAVPGGLPRPLLNVSPLSKPPVFSYHPLVKDSPNPFLSRGPGIIRPTHFLPQQLVFGPIPAPRSVPPPHFSYNGMQLHESPVHHHSIQGYMVHTDRTNTEGARRGILSDHYREGITHGNAEEERGRVRRDSDAEWEEWHRMREKDEYAGLMTPKEKAWLRNIQAMQLQTSNPYQDDYYYAMYSVKQQHKREEEVLEMDSLQLLLPDKKEGNAYEPPRLENSLGKLQVVSVNAPRKIIDLQMVYPDPAQPVTSLQKNLRRQRSLLLFIEKLYTSFMELDDLSRKIRLLPDCPTRDMFRSKSRQQAAKIWTSVTSAHENFVQIMCVRKGKVLIAELIHWLGETETEHILVTVIQNFALLSKRDTGDGQLNLFWPFVDRLISCSKPSLLLELGTMLTAQTQFQKNQSCPILSHKFGVSILLAVLNRAEHLCDYLLREQSWQKFLESAAVSISEFPHSEFPSLLPSVAMAASPHFASSHLGRCHMDHNTLSSALEIVRNLEVPPKKDKDAVLSVQGHL